MISVLLITNISNDYTRFYEEKYVIQEECWRNISIYFANVSRLLRRRVTVERENSLSCI